MIKTHQEPYKWVNSPAYFPIMIQSSNVQHHTPPGSVPQDALSQSQYYFISKAEYMHTQEQQNFLASLQQLNLAAAPLYTTKPQEDVAPGTKGKASTRLPSKSKRSTMNMTQLLSILNRKIAKEQSHVQVSSKQQQSTRNQQFVTGHASSIDVKNRHTDQHKQADMAQAQFQSL